MLTIAALTGLYGAKKWPIFTAPYDLNFFGLRLVGDPDAWDDALGVWYTTDAGRQVIEVWDGTTAPGVPGLVKPQNKNGTAILAPGYHRHAWQKGQHKSTYPCLVQATPLPVFRDSNRDRRLDAGGDVFIGWHALQCHHGAGNWRVGPYSLGCQLTRWPADLDRLLALLAMQEEHGHGNTLSYALALEGDLAPFLHAATA